MTWEISWYTCRANAKDVAWAKSQGRTIKIGEALWKVPKSIGPLGIDHNHWAGDILDCSEEVALIAAEAPEMLKLLRKVSEVIPDHDWENCQLNGVLPCNCEQSKLMWEIDLLLDQIRHIKEEDLK